MPPVISLYVWLKHTLTPNRFKLPQELVLQVEGGRQALGEAHGLLAALTEAKAAADAGGTALQAGLADLREREGLFGE